MLPKDALKIAEDIHGMRIRGAGQIARSAVEALEITAHASKAKDVKAFVAELTDASRVLLQTRPTAVSLPNGIRYVMHRINIGETSATSVEEIRAVALEATRTFIENTKTALQRIGEFGARRIRDGDVLLTHCNSSAVISVMKTVGTRKEIRGFRNRDASKVSGLFDSD